RPGAFPRVGAGGVVERARAPVVSRITPTCLPWTARRWTRACTGAMPEHGPSIFPRRSTMRSSPLRWLSAAGLLAALVAPPALGATTTPSQSADSAPFWSGKPNAEQFKARQEKRLAMAKNALDKMLAVKGTHTLANTLAPFDEISRQLDMAGAQ